MYAVINRLQDNDDKQTLGHFIMYDGVDVVFESKSLELPDRDNQTNISRINAGWYTCVLRTSEKYKEHFHVTDVEGRSLILIHFGNYFKNTRGCILLGDEFFDINGDGHLDITSSKDTINKLMSVTEDGFRLLINDLDVE